MQLKGHYNPNFRQTYLDGLHGTHHQNSFHHPGTEPAQQAFGAVQSARLILGAVAEELKHTKPEGSESIVYSKCLSLQTNSLEMMLRTAS